MPDVTFSSIEALQAALARLTGPELTKLGERAGRKIGEHLKNLMMRRPGPSHQPVKWASERQRRWWHAARRRDELPLKYTRDADPWSQKSQKMWSVKSITGGAIVGNSATYAPYIQSDEYQTEQHKATGWITDKQAVEEMEREGVIAKVVQAEIHDLVKGILG